MTAGGWPSADDGPYAWGYYFIRENDRQTQCSSDQWPCPAGMQYYGFYKRYCDLLGVSYGDNLDCYNQRPFA
uniref:Glycoside hydrolase family 19 catalytic domain-containing protein n=1 Tax=Salix viminalis TaxID=40686 RepID=A0A6N2LZ68_SALVM